MGHGLFVVRAVSWQPVSILVKGLSKGGNVSVAEYREHSAEERNDLVAMRAFKSCAQSGQVADKSLCGRQPCGAAPAQSGGFRNGYCFIHFASSSKGLG
jgi:hypothetical protein